jgi:hypothetical protein
LTKLLLLSITIDSSGFLWQKLDHSGIFLRRINVDIKGLVKLIPGVPAEVKDEVVPRVQDALENPAINAQLLILLGELQPAIEAAAKNSSANKPLQEAFNDVAAMLPPIRKLVEKKGEIGFMDTKKYIGLGKDVIFKKEKISEAFVEAFDAGDPAIIGLAQSLTGNKKFLGSLDTLGKVLPGFISPQAQQILVLVEDKAIRSDLAIIVAELQKSVNAASKDPATDEKLKEAFLGVDTSISAFSAYLKNLSLLDVPQSLMMDFVTNQKQYAKGGEVLAEAFKAKDPAVVNLAESLRANENALAALKRIVPKTHGNLFRLEKDADGQGYAVELVSGKGIKFALEKADFDEIRSALDAAPAPKNQPSPKPGV